MHQGKGWAVCASLPVGLVRFCLPLLGVVIRDAGFQRHAHALGPLAAARLRFGGKAATAADVKRAVRARPARPEARHHLRAGK